MSRPTIASLQAEITRLQQQIADMKAEITAGDVRQADLKTDYYKAKDEARRLRDIANAERKEVLWFRKRMRETGKAMDKLMDRISCTIDCVGRPTSDCEPMGQKLHLYVGRIIINAIQAPACDIRCMVNLDNCEAHGHIRDCRKDGLPAIEPEGGF
jgi:hypothetical protein